jgi:hypothetical protein
LIHAKRFCIFGPWDGEFKELGGFSIR